MARPRQITDEQILGTMRSCVLERGAQVSLDVVAGVLGVTAPALLKRFGTRQDLMLKALRPPDEPPCLAAFLAGPDGRPFRLQLSERLTELWAFLAEVVPCVAALRESGIPHEVVFQGAKQTPLQLLHAIAKWLAMANDAGLADVGSPESVATAILGAVQTRAFTSHVTKVKPSARSTRTYLEDLVELFARATLPHPTSKRMNR
jgi:AcrR family transcriptional regulator